uniref:DNA-directed RNA polymerase subunit alpha n=1 Tax=Atractomorpha echinata TaxID=52677 RepID=A0A140GIQ5_9CHLO|nr:alpha subunit of RNA polymerase [Atractomorpha echinata]
MFNIKPQLKYLKKSNLNAKGLYFVHQQHQVKQVAYNSSHVLISTRQSKVLKSTAAIFINSSCGGGAYPSLYFNSRIHNFKKIQIQLKVYKTELFVSCRESRIENPRSLYGSFYLGPFTAEQSLTVANAIRRTLLSELKGLAITSVEIEGATHEYSTLSGIRDSVLDILLNLKDLVLKSQFSFKKPQFGYIKVLGPGVVRAKDLKLPAFIQSVDPNQYIATLADNGVLNMKLKIEEGQNYLIQKPVNFKTSLNSVSKELLIKKLVNLKTQLNHSKLEKIYFKQQYFSSVLLKKNSILNKSTKPLLIDAVFMPVQKVNYIIEVDHENTNYRSAFFKDITFKNSNVLNHKIILEIWTNGSIHPREAISYAFKQLVSIFLNLEKAKIVNSFAFKSLLNNQSLINSIYFENFNYFEVIKKLNKNSSSFVPASTKKFINFDSKNITNIRNKMILKLDSKKNNSNFLNGISKKKIYLRDIGTLNISLRPYTCLKRANINTIQDLISYSKEELLLLKNFGQKSLQEVELSLIEIGLQLKP